MVYIASLYDPLDQQIWIFLATSVETQLLEPFEPSNHLRVALSNYVPRYEWIISDKQKQKSH